MTLNSITSGGSALQTTLPTAGLPGKVEPSVLSAKKPAADHVRIAVAEVANAGKPSSKAGETAPVSNGDIRKPLRTLNHVVESYNRQGKVRTRFLDSNNNVIYQIPSEMVAKIEDLMMKPGASADIKG